MAGTRRRNPQVPAGRLTAALGWHRAAVTRSGYDHTVVTTDDETLVTVAAIAKRTSALLRDARAVQRRLDVLAASALAMADSSLPRIAEARDAVARVVIELAYRERGEQRQAKAVRRRVP